MTVVVVDTETTGFGHIGKPPRPDGIVSVGMAWRNARGKLCAWEERCDPGEEYYSGGRAIDALRVNGLTEDAVRQYPPSTTIAERVRIMLSMIGCAQLRSYNQAFDRPFLEAVPWSLQHPWGDCIMLAATKPGGRWPKLKVACKERGIDTTGPLHSSGHDARLAYLLMEALNAVPTNP